MARGPLTVMVTPGDRPNDPIETTAEIDADARVPATEVRS